MLIVSGYAASTGLASASYLMAVAKYDLMLYLRLGLSGPVLWDAVVLQRFWNTVSGCNS